MEPIGIITWGVTTFQFLPPSANAEESLSPCVFYRRTRHSVLVTSGVFYRFLFDFLIRMNIPFAMQLLVHHEM